MSDLAEDSARELLDAVPLVMRAIRAEMRSQRAPGLSIPQFRVLTFLNRRPGASLSDLADHLGLTLPSVSKMVDGLVRRDLISRRESPLDRRSLVLDLTPAGRSMLESARAHTLARLTEMLSPLSESDLLTVIRAAHALRAVFSLTREIETGFARRPYGDLGD